MLKNEIILCKVENIDRYKRKLATCYKNKLNINSWLVRNGYALAYIKYSKKYILQEKEAKRDQLGIWQGTFSEENEKMVIRKVSDGFITFAKTIEKVSPKFFNFLLSNCLRTVQLDG